MADAYDAMIAARLPRERRRLPIAVIACAALLALIALGGPADGGRSDSPTRLQEAEADAGRWLDGPLNLLAPHVAKLRAMR